MWLRDVMRVGDRRRTRMSKATWPVCEAGMSRRIFFGTVDGLRNTRRVGSKHAQYAALADGYIQLQNLHHHHRGHVPSLVTPSPPTLKLEHDRTRTSLDYPSGHHHSGTLVIRTLSARCRQFSASHASPFHSVTSSTLRVHSLLQPLGSPL